MINLTLYSLEVSSLIKILSAMLPDVDSLHSL